MESIIMIENIYGTMEPSEHQAKPRWKFSSICKPLEVIREQDFLQLGKTIFSAIVLDVSLVLPTLFLEYFPDPSFA